MKRQLTALSIAVIGFLSLGNSLSFAGDCTAGHSSDFAPLLGGFDVIKPVVGTYVDAGGISASTGELLIGASAYLVTHVERPDGSVDPAFGPHPKGMLLSMTESGRYVVRFLEISSDRGWIGGH